MRDRLAARHFALGALEIDVDPLMVAGRVGEFVDLFLGDRVPVADPDLLAFIGLQIGGAFNFQHRALPLAMRLYADGDCFASLAMTSKKKPSLRGAQRRSNPLLEARKRRFDFLSTCGFASKPFVDGDQLVRCRNVAPA